MKRKNRCQWKEEKREVEGTQREKEIGKEIEMLVEWRGREKWKKEKEGSGSNRDKDKKLKRQQYIFSSA